jgi:4-amino-4-deoxy-L-arabinose transferase-like glycosyltransferase
MRVPASVVVAVVANVVAAAGMVSMRRSVGSGGALDSGAAGPMLLALGYLRAVGLARSAGRWVFGLLGAAILAVAAWAALRHGESALVASLAWVGSSLIVAAAALGTAAAAAWFRRQCPECQARHWVGVGVVAYTARCRVCGTVF